MSKVILLLIKLFFSKVNLNYFIHFRNDNLFKNIKGEIKIEI